MISLILRYWHVTSLEDEGADHADCLQLNVTSSTEGGIIHLDGSDSNATDDAQYAWDVKM
jgi:hypothetical protein